MGQQNKKTRKKRVKLKPKPTNIHVKFDVVQHPEWEHTIEMVLNFLWPSQTLESNRLTITTTTRVSLIKGGCHSRQRKKQKKTKYVSLFSGFLGWWVVKFFCNRYNFAVCKTFGHSTFFSSFLLLCFGFCLLPATCAFFTCFPLFCLHLN